MSYTHPCYSHCRPNQMWEYQGDPWDRKRCNRRTVCFGLRVRVFCWVCARLLDSCRSFWRCMHGNQHPKPRLQRIFQVCQHLYWRPEAHLHLLLGGHGSPRPQARNTAPGGTAVWRYTRFCNIPNDYLSKHYVKVHFIHTVYFPKSELKFICTENNTDKF